TVVAGDDGAFTITLTASDAAGNALAAQPAGRTFTVDTAAPAVTLSFDKDSAAVDTGLLSITATFSEPIVTTPSISIDRPGTGNDVGAALLGGTGDAKIWTFDFAVQPENDTDIMDGPTLIAVSDGEDLAGNPNQPASNNVVSIETSSSRTLTPANVVVASINTAPTFVSRGQTEITVTMSVQNLGQSTAAVLQTGATLSFNERLSGYRVTPIAGNTTIPGGEYGVYIFSVDVGTDAPLGVTAIDGEIHATDARSGVAIGDVGAITTDTWTVQSPTAMVVRSLRLPPVLIPSESFDADATIANLGQARAIHVTASLSLADEAGEFIEGYATADNPQSLAGQTDGHFRFRIQVPSTARTGPRTAQVVVSGRDGNSARDLIATGSFTGLVAIRLMASVAIGRGVNFVSLPLSPVRTGGGLYSSEDLLRDADAGLLAFLEPDPLGKMRFATYLPNLGRPFPVEARRGYILVSNRPEHPLRVTGNMWPPPSAGQEPRGPLALIGLAQEDSPAETALGLTRQWGAAFLIRTTIDAGGRALVEPFLPGLTRDFPLRAGEAYLLPVK
ncbi:MAG: hypothetical protein HYY25_00925, partial [Candidatus Wallbacteria bacterium]|nr:hypothetical protein [Candidatus Wallbacteria bacterium]